MNQLAKRALPQDERLGSEIHLDEWVAPEIVDEQGYIRAGKILGWMDVAGVLGRDAMMVFRLPIATCEALRRAAEAEQRTMSNVALHIVTKWLAAEGRLPESTNRTKSIKSHQGRRTSPARTMEKIAPRRRTSRTSAITA